MHTRWIGAVVGFVLAGAIGVFAQSWSSPRTWVVGETVTAALMNAHVRDNLSVLRAGGVAISSQAANEVIFASSASQLSRSANLTFNGSTLSVTGTITLPTTATGLISNTSDGSDTKSLGISGGGAAGTDSRGGYAFVYGNEHATNAGDVSIAAGNVAGAELLLSGTTVLTGRYNSASAQPGFLAYNSSDDTGATTGTVDFDTEKYDVAGNFSADTFTAPVTGEYLFTATVLLTSDATVGIAEIILADSGGDSYSVQHEFVASETTSLTGSWVIRLTAAETVTIQFSVPATGYVIEGAAHVTTFSGRLLP